MKLNAYLLFNGNCKAAFDFYHQVLGGDIPTFFTYGDSPMADQTSPDLRDKIMHVRLITGDNVLMGSDSPTDCQGPRQGFSVAIGVDTAEEAERIFPALSANGEVEMPLQETFWSVRFGMFIDQFGIPWMINCERQP